MNPKTSKNKLRNLRREHPKPRELVASLDPWERQPAETEKAWACFKAFRDAPSVGLPRTVANAARTLQLSRTMAARWSLQWRWIERVTAFDQYNDKEIVSARRKALLDMTAKHAAVAAGGIAVLQRPLAEMIERINNRTLDLKALTNKELTKLVVQLAPILRDFVGIERTARGVAGNADVYAMVDGLVGDGKQKPGGKTMAEIAEEMLAELEKKQAGAQPAFNDEDEDDIVVDVPPAALIVKGSA